MSGGRRRARIGERRVCDAQVVTEGPVDEPASLHSAQRGAEDARRHPRDEFLHAQHPLELPLVSIREGGVAAQRGLRARPAIDDASQLAPAGDAEVEGRADPFRGKRQAVSGGVAHEEDTVGGCRTKLVGDPVALVANRVALEVAGEPDRRLLDVKARVERTDADAYLLGGGEAPRVAGGYVVAVDPDLQLIA
jgi:hypothetical protein